MAGARFHEVIATKLPVDPRLPVTGMERADRKQLRPLWGDTGYLRTAGYGNSTGAPVGRRW
jgi:hypothetical protein